MYTPSWHSSCSYRRFPSRIDLSRPPSLSCQSVHSRHCCTTASSHVKVLRRPPSGFTKSTASIAPRTAKCRLASNDSWCRCGNDWGHISGSGSESHLRGSNTPRSVHSRYLQSISQKHCAERGQLIFHLRNMRSMNTHEQIFTPPV